MSGIANIVNGEVQNSKTSTTSKSSGGDSLGKDAFLQLLVTQMKYQDPLEPTDNTEYVSQLATFSELEEMQNLSSNMDLSRASALVGQYVTINATNESTGQTTLIGGKVDYVVVENNKAYLNINGENYSIDDLDSVVDEEYLNAYNLANDFTKSLDSLPKVDLLTTTYKEVIENLRAVYDDMTNYQKSFITDSQISKLKEYEEKLNSLLSVEE